MYLDLLMNYFAKTDFDQEKKEMLNYCFGKRAANYLPRGER